MLAPRLEKRAFRLKSLLAQNLLPVPPMSFQAVLTRILNCLDRITGTAATNATGCINYSKGIVSWAASGRPSVWPAVPACPSSLGRSSHPGYGGACGPNPPGELITDRSLAIEHGLCAEDIALPPSSSNLIGTTVRRRQQRRSLCRPITRLLCRQRTNLTPVEVNLKDLRIYR